MDLSALFGRLLLKAHVKSHYRVQGGKVVYIHEYDTKAHGEHPEASLHQRSALGEHAKEGAYIRATDSADRDAIKKVAQGLGVNTAKIRRAGANHHGRQGAYDHLHFASVEDAAKVHAHLQGGPGEAAVKPQDPAIVSQTVNPVLAKLLDQWLPMAQDDDAKKWTPEALENTGYIHLQGMKEKAMEMADLAMKIKSQYESAGDHVEAADWGHVTGHWVKRAKAVFAAIGKQKEEAAAKQAEDAKEAKVAEAKNLWLGKHVKAGDFLKDKDGNTWEAGPYSPLGADLVPPGGEHYETLDWQEIAALDLKPTGRNATDEADPPPSNFDTWTPDGSTLVPDAEWTLKNTSAGHDKTYRVEVHKDPTSGKFLVLAAWGKTGKPQTSALKGSWNTAEAAKKSAVAIVNEKLGKGYYHTKIHEHTWAQLYTPIQGAPLNPAGPAPASAPDTPPQASGQKADVVMEALQKKKTELEGAADPLQKAIKAEQLSDAIYKLEGTPASKKAHDLSQKAIGFQKPPGAIQTAIEFHLKAAIAHGAMAGSASQEAFPQTLPEYQPIHQALADAHSQIAETLMAEAKPAPAPPPAPKPNPKYAGLDWKQISGDVQTLYSDYLKTKKVTQELVSAAKLAAVVAHHKSQAGMPETEGTPWKSVASIWAAQAKWLMNDLAAGGK